MRQAPVRQVSRVDTIPAPIRGINALDSIAAMPKGFALVLRNMYAQPFGCQVRRGFRKHVTAGIVGDVQTLMTHNGNMGDTLFAFAGTSMYDVTAPNVSAVSKLSGLTNAQWEHINFSNAAGVHGLAVNGADNMVWVQPNGAVTTISAGDGSGNTISGVDPKALTHIYSHQKRVWFVEKNSSRGWYLPPDQITGIAKSFDFGPLWTRGGILNQIITWSVDDGDGSDDLLLAISSEGQISFYRGLDVEDASSWALQGVYYAGAPVGRRSAVRVGGDVALLCELGIVKVSNLLKSTKVNPVQDNEAAYIQQILSAIVSEFRDEFGWQLFVFPAANMFMINAPASQATSFQFVLNDVNKAWSEFIGYNANCWELHKQLPFFGGFQAVYRAWEGTTDDATVMGDGTVIQGDAVRFEAQTAFDYFNTLGQQKHFKMIRPTILSSGAFTINMSVNTDFVFNSPTSPSAFNALTPGVWDEDTWDSAIWEGGLLTFKNWQSANGIGTAAAIRLLGASVDETYWVATDWLYEIGGVL